MPEPWKNSPTSAGSKSSSPKRQRTRGRRLSLGGYYRVEIDPGPLKITYRTPLFGIPMFMSPQKLETTVEENKFYFVSFGIESVMRISRLKLVPQAIGENEIKTTQLLVN